MQEGICITGGATDTKVGGTTPETRNLISGDQNDGVKIYGTSSNEVLGNLIGTSKDGKGALGPSGEGISIIGPDNVVGGDSAAAANTIAFNNGPGVHISFDESKGNRMLGNSIFSNAGRGIDLGSGDIEGREQDTYDGDPGPNNLQNFPFVTSARTSDTKTTVKGELYSIPNQTFAVRFFSNPPDTDEGKKFLGKKEITTSVDGIRSFAFVPARRVGVGRTITATATGPGGNTSEFSAAPARRSSSGALLRGVSFKKPPPYVGISNLGPFLCPYSPNLLEAPFSRVCLGWRKPDIES